MDAGVVEADNVFIDCTRRCRRCSLRSVYFSAVSRRSSSWRCIFSKNVCSILTVVLSFVEEAVQKNAKKGFWLCPVPGTGHAARAKDPSAFVGRKSLEWVVHHRVSEVLTCGLDQ